MGCGSSNSLEKYKNKLIEYIVANQTGPVIDKKKQQIIKQMQNKFNAPGSNFTQNQFLETITAIQNHSKEQKMLTSLTKIIFPELQELETNKQADVLKLAQQKYHLDIQNALDEKRTNIFRSFQKKIQDLNIPGL